MKRIIFEHNEANTVYFDQLKEPNLIMVKCNGKFKGSINRMESGIYHYTETTNTVHETTMVRSTMLEVFMKHHNEYEYYLID